MLCKYMRARQVDTEQPRIDFAGFGSKIGYLSSEPPRDARTMMRVDHFFWTALKERNCSCDLDFDHVQTKFQIIAALCLILRLWL